jgi:hypothetical protein
MSDDKIPNLKNKSRSITTLILIGLFMVLIISLHGYLGERSKDYIGIRAWLDTIYTIILYVIITLSAGGIGWVVLEWIGLIPFGEKAEISLIALVIGYGIIAYGILFLGITGFLYPTTLWIWLVLAGLVGIRHWARWAQPFLIFTKLRNRLKFLDYYQKLLVLFGICILVLTFFQALTPPWDYDSQLYHLEVPRKFLLQNQITPQPEDWLSYFPLTVEMLYTMGLGLGSDVLAKLIHLTFGVVLAFSTYAFGKRFFGKRVAWLALGVLLGVPIIPIWASWAYVDLGYSAFLCMSAYAVLTWSETERTPWLVVAGILMGFGLGTKYMALGAAASLGFLVLWFCRHKGWRKVLDKGIIFGGISFIIGVPWYLKNFLWSGNPIYPLLGGPPSWSPIHMDIWMSFVRGFGTGKSLQDYVLLPLNLYIHHERFATGMGSIDLPSFLFPIAILYPLSKRNKSLNALVFLILAQFIFWAFGSQVNRYLLPIYPLLGLLTGSVIANFETKLRLGNLRLGIVLSHSLVLSLVFATFIYNTIYFIDIRPLEVTFGSISKSEFLRRNVDNYSTIEYIETNLDPEARVFMLWDGKGYYCKERCIPDTDHSQWTDLVFTARQNISAIAEALRARGATHLLINYEDADYILQHDPMGYQKTALIFFVEEFRPNCTKELFSNKWTALYELTCNP